MRRRYIEHGFSLAEMMVVLMVIAIIMAATAPMITRKISRERSDKVFDMLNVDPTNAVEYIKGRKQRLFMNARENGYVGIREAGQTIPENSVLFGRNSYSNGDKSFVGIGFNTKNRSESVSVGFGTDSAVGGVAIGQNAEAFTYSVSIGYGARSKKANSMTKPSNTIAIGYNAVTVAPNSVALGKEAETALIAKNSVAIGSGAKAIYPHTIVLGSKDDTVYIPGNLVVEHSALIGRSAGRTDNLYFRPYAQEDGRHFAVLNAGDWKGEDSNLSMAQYATNTDYLGVQVGPYQTETEYWRKDYKDNNRTHINYLTPEASDSPGSYKHSDIRLKDVGSEFSGGLEELSKLKFYNYTFKKDKTKQAHVGVIAQDLQKVFPASVKTGRDGFLEIRWDEMFYAVINAVKELNNKMSVIIEKISNLDARTDKQQALIEAQSKALDEQQVQIKNLSDRIDKLEKRKK